MPDDPRESAPTPPHAAAAADALRAVLADYGIVALVLQGGGALGAYQAGAYEGFAAAGVAPDWVAGVSIGAINAALFLADFVPAAIAWQAWETSSR